MANNGILTDNHFDMLASVNYEFFLEYVHGGDYKHGEHTRYIANVLQDIEAKHAQGQSTFTIIEMPPRHSKSMSITESFPSWFIGRNPKRRVIQASYGGTLARKFGLSNLQKIEGKAGRIFGLEIDPRKSAANNFNIKGAGGGMVSTGIGGAITGEGADLLIIDDPIRNRRDANSPSYRDFVWGEWKATLSTRLQPGASVIVILTRWHEDDLAGRILEHDSRDWNEIKIPCIAQENDLLGRSPGEPLWPENGFGLEWADKTKRAVGALDWASLYQQDPRPQQGALLNRNYWKRFSKYPDAREFDKIIFSWDCTFKDLETSDFVVGQTWGKMGPDFYLLDQVRERMGIVQTMEAIKAMAARWPSGIGTYIEDKANGSAVIEMLKSHISGIIPVSPTEGKVSRAQAVLPLIMGGNVYIPTNDLASWAIDFVNECASFPYGKNDDQVDCATQALKELSHDDGLFIGRV